MAFENYPQASGSEFTNNNTPAPKNYGKTLLTGGLVAALLGTWGYIIYDKNKTKESIAQKETIIATTSTEREQLKSELDEAARRYDELKTGNAKKDSTISAKDIEIDSKKQRIAQLLAKANASQSELAEAKRLIQSLKYDLDDYKEQVTVLQGQKVKLIAEKEAVTQQRDSYRRNYDSTSLVVKQKEKIIEVGSTLHASNFDIVGINNKRNGREKITSVSKRVDKFRISFDLDENMITESGNKELYICVTGPDGNPVNLDREGGGTFSTRSGQELPYTQRIDVNYIQNKKQTVSFEWKPTNTNFSKGNYKIEVYNNGFKVGEGYKDLRKGGLFS
jgi:hypothetical protein